MTKTISTYRTKKGLVAFEVKETVVNGRTTYSYEGKHGAGCGQLKDIVSIIKLSMTTRRGISHASGLPLHTLNLNTP